MDEGASWKRHRDVRAERDALGGGGRQGDGQIGIVARLGGPQAVVAELLGVAGEPRHVAQVGDEDTAVDLHARGPYSTTARAVKGMGAVRRTAPGRATA